jgi:asparagine synthase (glutamine-hydrolysing)
MCGIAESWYSAWRLASRGRHGDRDARMHCPPRPEWRRTWVDAEGRVGLGHRRLSIIDLATAAPRRPERDGSLHIIFNGEIYNHAELRKELSKSGAHRGRRIIQDTGSHPPIATKMGIACASFPGMFAFVLWDASALCWCAIGWHQAALFFVDRDRCTFASEIKALLAGSASVVAFTKNPVPITCRS